MDEKLQIKLMYYFLDNTWDEKYINFDEYDNNKMYLLLSDIMPIDDENVTMDPAMWEDWNKLISFEKNNYYISLNDTYNKIIAFIENYDLYSEATDLQAMVYEMKNINSRENLRKIWEQSVNCLNG